MRPVSPEFSRIVRGSHQMCARARIVPPGQTGVDPDGDEVAIVSGDVLTDATADVLGTLDLVTDGRGWSTRADGLITPYGAECFVERGIVHGNGNREWVSLGYYRIEGVEQRRAPNGRLRITGSDRMAGLIDARLLQPIQFGQGTSVRDIVEYLVGEVYPGAVFTYDFDPDDTTLGAAQIAEKNRHGFLIDLVSALGKVMFWDYEGKLRIETAPDPNRPVFDVTHGRDGVLVELSRSVSRDGVYNAVVATGEVPIDGVPPVRAVAYDMSPQSPTRWGGPFGKVPRFYSSSFITTQAQARDAARAMLAKQLGLPYTVDFSAVPHPGLESRDPVRVSYGDHADTEIHVLERIMIPLTADRAMTATTRQQHDPYIEVM